MFLVYWRPHFSAPVVFAVFVKDDFVSLYCTAITPTLDQSTIKRNCSPSCLPSVILRGSLSVAKLVLFLPAPAQTIGSTFSRQ